MTDVTGDGAHEVDVIVVGAGHNALICAAYLADAGLEIAVLEARDIIGGNTATEELTLPGWRHDTCSSAHVVIQSNPLLRFDELGLVAKYGLRYLVSDPAVVFPLDDGDALVIHPDLEATAARFARHSSADARALEAMIGEWDAGLKAAHGRFQAGLEPLDDDWTARYDALRARSAWDVVMDTFSHPVIRRAMIWMAFATIQPPHRRGTGALPAAIMAGRLQFGWSTPMGGSGSLPDALAAHLTDHGATISTSSLVTRFLVESGRCAGVQTADGRTLRARRAVVTGSHLRTLPEALTAPAPEVKTAAAAWRPGLSVFAVHLALRQHPTYETVSGQVRAVAGGLGSPEGLSRQVEAALAGRIDADDPWLLMVDSTVVDFERAPGAAFKFLTIAPELIDGRAWDDASSRAFAEKLVGIARRHVSGLEPDNILFLRPESPTTLAAHNPANIGGSCHGGEFHLDDGSVIPGWRDYRTGIDGLYLTGSTSHPGGSVSGRPGRNTARVVLGDLGFDASLFTEHP